MASKGLRSAARAIDSIAELVLVIVAWYAFGDLQKLFTDLFLAAAVITAYEALSCLWFGGTPGMRLLGLRVAELDLAGRPTGATAVRRGMVVSVLTVIPFIGWALWAASMFGDALGRGFPDRVSNSMVVPDDFRGAVATTDLAGFADGIRPPRLTPLGRVGDLDVRFRARLRRLQDSRLLAASLGLLALAVSLEFTTLGIILVSSALWIVIFVAHETWLVHRTGRTPGHVMAGLVIVSQRTGLPPSGTRSFFRALVLGLLLYIPLLWWLLAISMLMMRHNDTGRGLHDLAGGTLVVADPRLDPETQRQRAMRMRLGRAG
ncbi:MAG: domain containing protein [Ilumatobacteraceae bacterium]|nr:domain containing protein [Ilumatobacteraceae bacterium]